MKIERANLARYLNLALNESTNADIEDQIWFSDRPFDDSHTSIQTQQIRDALEAIENGEQLEIV